MNRKEIKQKAWEIANQNKWNIFKPILIVGLISMIVGVICGFAGLSETATNSVASLLSLILLPASVGMLAYNLEIARGKQPDLSNIKKYYSLFINIIVIDVLIAIFVFLWSILLVIPGIIAAISYSMVYYCLIDNESLSASDAIRASKELMNGHKWEYVVFELSFIGWALLVGVTFGIASIWVIPYVSIAQALFYDELTKKN